MTKLSTRKLTFSGVFIAFGLLLPLITAQLPSVGSKLLPMHLPVLIAGFVCGWKYGLAVGIVVPVFRSILFGMPPMFPTAVAMAAELAFYGCISGLLYRMLPMGKMRIYTALIAAMVCGRIAWGAASLFLYGLNGVPFTWEIFAAGAFFNAVPGILIQLAAVPVIVIGLERAGVIQNVQ